MERNSSRRRFIRESLEITGGVALAGLGIEEQALAAQLSGRLEPADDQEPIAGLQKGRFGELEVSRLIIGGNQISGSAHAGDLVYQSALMTRYFTDAKIQETWSLAEANGVNTTLMRADPHIVRNYQTYRKQGGHLHWIAQTAPEQGDPVENTTMARDHGAYAVYFHGGRCDDLVAEGKLDQVEAIVAGMRRTGVFAGVGAHRLETIKAIESAGIGPDFYMCTVNRVGYLSSEPTEIESFMCTVRRPWIAFKVLGAGRDRPPEGFLQAFRCGADFIAVGMFDWQVRSDVRIARDILAQGVDRQRPWQF